MSTYGPDRQKIYKYLEEQGLEVTPERHAVIKGLLLEYVNHQNAALLDEAKAWRNHQPKCEMFKARAEARKNRSKRAGFSKDLNPNQDPLVVKPFPLGGNIKNITVKKV